jgi:hypothetical protein
MATIPPRDRVVPTCPRCHSGDTRLIAESPLPGVWEMYGCNHCTYLWRNTETLEGIRTMTEEEIKSAVLDFPPPSHGGLFR